jgi:hypothetical protein
MIKENRASKYLLYAIGEIVLVVIGILIALQINNWNEERKSHSQEVALLNQLQSEFESNQDQLEEKIAIRNDIIESALILLSYVDEPASATPDSVLKHLAQSTLAPTFDPIVNDLISSGRIQLLQSTDLKERLSRLTSEIVQVTEEEQVLKEFQNTIFLELTIDHYSLRNIMNSYWVNNTTASFQLDKGIKDNLKLGYSKQLIDYMSILTHPQFEDHLAFIATMAQIANTQSISLNGRISEIIHLIEHELEEEQ